MKEDTRIYVRWTGDQLIKAITVSGVGINELITPFTDGVPKRELEAMKERIDEIRC